MGKAPKEVEAHRGSKVPLELREQLEHKDKGDHKAILEPRELQEHKGRKDP